MMHENEIQIEETDGLTKYGLTKYTNMESACLCQKRKMCWKWISWHQKRETKGHNRRNEKNINVLRSTRQAIIAEKH